MLKIQSNESSSQNNLKSDENDDVFGFFTQTTQAKFTQEELQRFCKSHNLLYWNVPRLSKT